MAKDQWQNSPLDPSSQASLETVQPKMQSSDTIEIKKVVREKDAEVLKEKTSVSNFEPSFVFDRQTFSSQVPLTGRFRLDIGTTEKTALIKSITLELKGVETIYSNHIAAKEEKAGKQQVELSNDSMIATKVDPCSKTFLYKTITLQDEQTPPCDAVKAGSMPEDGYWKVQKGSAIFPFHFKIPESLPCSWKGSKGDITYSVSAVIKLKIKGSKQVLKKEESINVFEALPLPLKFTSVMTSASKHLTFGGKGELESICTINCPIVTAGSYLYLNLLLNNHSKKKVNAVKLALIRKVKTFSVGTSLTGQAESTLINLWRKTMGETIVNPREFAVGSNRNKKDGIVNASSPREIICEMLIPNGLISVRHTQHIQVTYVLKVSVGAAMNKDLECELPVEIIHPLTHQPLPQISYNPSLFIHQEDPPERNVDNSPQSLGLPRATSVSPVVAHVPVTHRKAPLPPLIVSEKAARSIGDNRVEFSNESLEDHSEKRYQSSPQISASHTIPQVKRAEVHQDRSKRNTIVSSDKIATEDEGFIGSDEHVDKDASPLKAQLQERMKGLRASPVGQVTHSLSKSPSHAVAAQRAEDLAVVQDLDNILSDLSKLNQALEA